MSTATVAAHGMRVTLPPQWEARLYRRTGGDHDPDEPAARWAAHPAARGHPDESVNPVLHLANFPLPPGRGDFGTGAVEQMGPGHVFVAVVEYDPAEAGRALFAAQGLPRLKPRDFAPNQLQRTLPGQLGAQRFCTVHGRAFCVYVVLGGRTRAPALVGEVNDVLSATWMAPR